MRKKEIPQFIYWALAVVIVLAAMLTGGRSGFFAGDSMVTSTPAPPPPTLAENGLYVHFIDVGQGDSALIVCDGEAMLIDGGEIGRGQTVVSYLSSNGVSELCYMISTHAHSDHCGGLDDVAETFPVDSVFAPYTEFDESGAFTRFETTLIESGEYITIPPLGGVLTLGGGTFTFIGPVGEYDSVNSGSLVFRFDYGDTSVLFTGDSETDSLSDIMAAGYDLSCDILKLPHHGSSDGLDEALLSAMSPRYAVASCGVDNDYGHPHPSILRLLSDSGVTLYRTDKDGSVVFYSDGTDIKKIS